MAFVQATTGFATKLLMGQYKVLNYYYYYRHYYYYYQCCFATRRRIFRIMKTV